MRKPKSYNYFMDRYGYVGMYLRNPLNSITEDEFIEAWIYYINNDSVDKNFEQDLFENDSMDSYLREMVKDRLLEWKG